jgi:hypothetical protein
VFAVDSRGGSGMCFAISASVISGGAGDGSTGRKGGRVGLSQWDIPRTESETIHS